MRSKDLPFHVLHGSNMDGRTTDELSTWMDTYTRVLYPENGLEGWCDRLLLGQSPTVGDLVRKAGKHGRPQVLCNASYGHCEGNRVDLGLQAGECYVRLLSAKHFGSMDEAWAIARAVYMAMHMAIAWEEEPSIVGMANLVPASRRSSVLMQGSALVGGRILMDVGDTHVDLRTASGESFVRYDAKPQTLGCSIQDFAKDWALIAKAYAVSFDVTYSPSGLKAAA